MSNLDLENKILKEVEGIFGGAYPKMMAECINKCETLQKLLKVERYFFMQECIRVSDVPILTSGYSITKSAKLMGVTRNTARKYIKDFPDKPVIVVRDDNGEIVKLEIK